MTTDNEDQEERRQILLNKIEAHFLAELDRER